MRDTTTLKNRLDAYRALLQRDGPVPELVRLVALLETELDPKDGPDSGGDVPAPPPRRPPH